MFNLFAISMVRRVPMEMKTKFLFQRRMATTETKNKVKGRLFLNVIISQSPAIFQLFAGKDEPLLIRWDSFLILNLCLNIVNGIGAFNLQGDCFAGQSLDKYLHPSTKPQNKVKGGFLLDIIISQGPPIFQLFASEDQTLLVRWDAFLVLNLGLNVVDGVGTLDFEGDGLADEVEGGFFLDVIIGKGPTVFELFASENETLLVGWDPFLVLDLGLDVVDGVGAFDLECYGLAGKGFHKDLHLLQREIWVCRDDLNLVGEWNWIEDEGMPI
ncbi:hypothetical protein CXB51_023551 [Gossypium anomalum]|uniref:Uncharacterized protein n=1 Tax=Gossypium anomalum TaxID=47600 RepID=A0A8J5YQ24_9ROSI|nr:hypothetical protein CXB51_023551 [Gossypium anomalum]